MKIIKGTEQKVAYWSGGTTTQLAIWPEDALYAERNFLWRLSTATVDDEESVFTSLPDYQRFLGIRKGTLMLNHGNNSWLYMNTNKVTVFDGGAPTRSRGQVTDMNLMIRKGEAEGAMQSVMVRKNLEGRCLREFMDMREAVQGSDLELCPASKEPVAGDIFAIYHSSGADITLRLPEDMGGENMTLQAGDLAIWNLTDSWKLSRVLSCDDCHLFGFWVMRSVK